MKGARCLIVYLILLIAHGLSGARGRRVLKPRIAIAAATSEHGGGERVWATVCARAGFEEEAGTRKAA